MANLGPKAGEANHFRNYAAHEKQQYAIDRFTNELNRLYGVMNARLKDREFLAGKYSIADIASIGWATRFERQGQDMNNFPNVRRWMDKFWRDRRSSAASDCGSRQPAKVNMQDPKVRAVLFGQRAR
jgi:GST-like protein